MSRFAYLSALLVLMAACGQKPATSIDGKIDLIVHCGTLIDGLSDEIFNDQIIVIRDERISAILAADDPTIVDAEILNLSEHTCLPGLIDTHVHLALLPEDAEDYRIYLQRTVADTQRLAEENAEKVIRSGFTTVRQVGAYVPDVIRTLHKRIDAGETPGPRIQTAGPYLTIPQGGGDMYLPGVDDKDVPSYYRTGVASGPDEFREKAETAVADGADFLKVIASGAVFGYGGVVGAREMSYDEIKAVVDVAKAAGIKVTAHAHGADSIKDAILAGVDAIEHASLGTDESIALALEHGVAFSMDVYNGTYTEEVGYEQNYAEEFMRKNEETTEAQRVVFRKALAAGVTLLFGTDLGVLPHDLGTRQFLQMVELGMRPMHAIKSATSTAADHMEMAKDVGAIEVGRFGDLIAIRGNPLEDISTLQKVDYVIKGGSIIH
jgi:imidazolonepropionase-like amidohydrolase